MKTNKKATASHRTSADEFDVIVGEYLREKRKEQRYSRDFIAQYLGVTVHTYGKYERGVIQIAPKYLFKLFVLFGIKLQGGGMEMIEYFQNPKIILDISKSGHISI